MKTTFNFLLLFLLSFGPTNSHAQKDNTTIKQVLDKYFEAIGGKQKALQVTSFTSESKCLYNDNEFLFIQKSMLPNSFLQEIRLSDKIISKLVFNGKTAHRIHNRQRIKVQTKELNNFKKTSAIFPEFSYYKNAKYLGIEYLKEKAYHVVKTVSKKIYYDRETGLKTLSKTKLDANANEQKIHFSKYIAIEGLKFPSKFSFSIGEAQLDFQTYLLTLNRDVTENDFK
ncbi:hypothetical protein [Flavicella sediminum]|uniref:hypothetical protein n=1 Tax=Flavicella sediminum TaxID=2585141 RepID=UPI0011232238|nr:hypothetical protein [Flavicella sediminum]